MTDEMADLRDARPEHGPWSLPIWLNVVVIALGTFVTIGYTQRLLAGRRPTDFEWLFGWDMGSWWWTGQLVIIVGWCGIIYFRVRDLMRRHSRGVST